MENVKPCPFCGGAGEMHTRYSEKLEIYFVSIKCISCNAEGREFRQREVPIESTDPAVINAITAWNMRTSEK